MHKVFVLLLGIFLLNGCAETVALLGGSISGASSGKMVQSSLQSTVSYGIKKTTGKTPLGHALAYAEVVNPEKNKETCVSFIEKTRSEFCSVVKKKIATTNTAIKKKALVVLKKDYKIKEPVVEEKTIVSKNLDVEKKEILEKELIKSKKSPRELAIAIQNRIKKEYKKIIQVSR